MTLQDPAVLPTQYQQFIHLSRYARWDYENERRETWAETVNRYFSFFQEHLQEQCDYTLENGELEEMKQGVLALDVMPSMRCLMTAGEAVSYTHLTLPTTPYV